MQVRRLLPDLGDALCRALDQTEEVLLTLAEWETDPDEPGALPDPLARRAALRALHRVQDAINPTQTLTDERGTPVAPRITGPGAARLLTPGGHREHRALRLVTVDTADLDVLTRAAATLGLTLAARPNSELAEAIATGADAAGPHTAPPPDPTEIVVELTRTLGLLDLATTADTRLLTARLDATEAPEVILTAAEEAAYRRLNRRFDMLWAAGPSIDHHRR
jgi:hypothetical protein